MAESIYFTKLEFIINETGSNTEKIILVDIPQEEVIFQVFPKDIQQHTVFLNTYINGNTHRLTCTELVEQEPLYSYVAKLSEQKLSRLLPCCNARDFVPFQHREMLRDDPGFQYFRENYMIDFRGITDSFIPMIELPMHAVYNVEHEWPSERLYRVLLWDILSTRCKKLKKWLPYYDGALLWER